MLQPHFRSWQNVDQDDGQVGNVEGEGLNWGGQDYSWGTFGHFELGWFPRDGEQLMQLD